MKIKTPLIPVFLLFIIACNKNESTNTPQQDPYLTISAGSTWNYHEIDSSGTAPVSTDYTLTSTSRDSSISGKNYHIFSNSTGGSQYLGIMGHDYYQFDSLPVGLGIPTFERLYLKDNEAVGVKWSQDLTLTLPGVPIPVPAKVTYEITERGISRTVNGVNYTDVIHVTTTINSTLIPVASFGTNINGYYAKKYGLIESSVIIHLDYTGIVKNVNTEIKLVSANLL